MDFLDRLKEYLEGLSFTPATINIGLYQADGDDIAIRPSPSNISERHIDKGKIYPFAFQVLVHHKNNLTGYQTSQDLLSKLDNLASDAIISSNNSFAMVSFHCTTSPRFVEKTSHGVLWTASYEAELYIIGG